MRIQDDMLVYYLIVNAIAFLIYGIDKLKAKADAWRIPEKTLILLAVIGGAFGAFLGMKVFHHKTRKPLFKFLVPLFAMVHIGVIIFVSMKFGENLW